MRSEFQKIEKLLGYDIENFFNIYDVFVSNHLPSLKYFYKTDDANYLPFDSFKVLENLLEESKFIYNKINNHKNILNNSVYFEIINNFEEIYSKLLTWNNLGVWMHSEKDIYRDMTSRIPYQLSKNETIEQMSSEVGYANRDEGFVDITWENRTKETDWDLHGGNRLYYRYTDTYREMEYDIITLVGTLFGEKVYGLDIDQNFIFEDNDLKTLMYRDTFIQTCNILINLRLNDNPEFPNDGIDKRMLSNRQDTFMSMPILKRNMIDYIGRDDTIRNFVIRDVNFEGDAIFMKVEFYSQLNNNDFIPANYQEAV